MQRNWLEKKAGGSTADGTGDAGCWILCAPSALAHAYLLTGERRNQLSKFNREFYIVDFGTHCSILFKVSHNHQSVSKAMVAIRLAVAEWNSDHPDHYPGMNWYELVSYGPDIPGVKIESIPDVVEVNPGESVVLL